MEPLPFKERKIDWLIAGFFLINVLFISYCIDLENITVTDSYAVQAGTEPYPLMPPKVCVDLVHWYATRWDPVILARPAWWRATIHWDAWVFGPFYLLAIWALIKGKEWIRIPAVFYSGLLFMDVSIILFEETLGQHATPSLPFVLALNGPWITMPLVIAARMWVGGDRLFSRLKAKAK